MRSLEETLLTAEGPLARRLREAAMGERRSRHLTSLVRCDHCGREVDLHEAYHATISPIVGVDRWVTLCEACRAPMQVALYRTPR